MWHVLGAATGQEHTDQRGRVTVARAPTPQHKIERDGGAAALDTAEAGESGTARNNKRSQGVSRPGRLHRGASMSLRRNLGLLFASVLIACTEASTPSRETAAPMGGSADIVLRGGPIYTMDASRSWARAVAIKDGALIHVGSEADVTPFIGPRTRVVELNRRTLDRLTQSLGRADADAVRDAYHRRAYPRIFEDDGSAWPELTAALDLPDLTGDQRVAIQDLSVEFRSSYDDLCRQLVELRLRVPLDQPAWGGQRWRSATDRNRSSERLETDRTNLSDKARLRLKSRLSEEQARRVFGS